VGLAVDHTHGDDGCSGGGLEFGSCRHGCKSQEPAYCPDRNVLAPRGVGAGVCVEGDVRTDGWKPPRAGPSLRSGPQACPGSLARVGILQILSVAASNSGISPGLISRTQDLSRLFSGVHASGVGASASTLSRSGPDVMAARLMGRPAVVPGGFTLHRVAAGRNGVATALVRKGQAACSAPRRPPEFADTP
jgi:hypothetical protein